MAVNGAKVYIVGRTKEKLDRVAEVYGKNIPGQIIPLQGDVTKKDDIARMYNEVKSKEKCVCILVNNAGVSSNVSVHSRLGGTALTDSGTATQTFQTEASNAEEMSNNLFHNKDATFEDWNNTYSSNVPQAYFMTMAFLPLLEASTQHQHGYSGCVINICSISGLVRRAQHHFAYNGQYSSFSKIYSGERSCANCRCPTQPPRPPSFTSTR